MLDDAEPTTRDRVAVLVTNILTQKGQPRPVSDAGGLVDAGMTSMDMVGLMLAVEAEFDLTIPPGEITPVNFQSIAAIERMVDRLRAEPA